LDWTEFNSPPLHFSEFNSPLLLDFFFSSSSLLTALHDQIDRDFNAKLCDFGLSRVVAAKKSNAAMTGNVG